MHPPNPRPSLLLHPPSLRARDAAEKRALELDEEPPAKKIPKTIENAKEVDETVCKPDDEELFAGNDVDEFSSILKRELNPKILLAIVVYANKKDFTSLIVVHTNRREPGWFCLVMKGSIVLLCY
ncbi:hypothetical protein C1H46_004319 [Malus baccata]|uniref:Uncharacterized protein n=1 Tax=Malus baccata TaxID=106549 RepID=A0A540NG85_MALBA|nr:hypothetical protein C1H46_004319 [Malus baccata]